MNNLQRKHPNKKAKRVGRGGLRGKTSGRGHKGQKQHGGHGIRVELRDQIKKIPKLRGRGVNSNKSHHLKPVAVNLSVLEKNFKAGDTVSPITLQENGVISGMQARKHGVKILGNGDLSLKLTVEGCTVSKTAEEKITKQGGSVV
jgi:large subunit ribosomal protein L15